MSYEFFNEELLQQFGSSKKESIDDFALDEEEVDKVEFEVSQSFQSVSLRVDYSNFANHVFFGAAYPSVYLATQRLLSPENGFPWNGELKDKNEWRRINSGYDNWFFDNYPKQQGFAFFNSASNQAWIEVRDPEQKIIPNTSSVLFEFALKAYETPIENQSIISYTDLAFNNGFNIGLSASKEIYFTIKSGSLGTTISASYSSFISSSNFISCLYDFDTHSASIFFNGEGVHSSSVATLGAITQQNLKFYIGSRLTNAGVVEYFSGALDDVRVWHSKRSPTLIKRNFYRTINANHSGGLKLYFKFNEPAEATYNIPDYSGNNLYGIFTGSFSVSTNRISGTLGSWFKDGGDPIYFTNNSRVDAFLSEQQNSASYFDKENRNNIFNLVPSFFINEEGNEEMQMFLLLVARHYDRLKLYIQHLSNVLFSNESEFNNAPDELLNVLAKNYGLDLGGVYESAGPLEYFFGEDVLVTGSLDTPIKAIRNQLRRNLVNNLSYILKSKSTKEALEASLRSLGLDENIVSISEYSTLSGGIQTTFTPKTLERRVAFLTTSSFINLTSSVYSSTNDRTYEVRVLFDTGSVSLTSSIFSILSSSQKAISQLYIERENLTSSYGVVKLFNTGSTSSLISSSLLPLFNNNWVSFAVVRQPTVGGVDTTLRALAFDRDEMLFHFSGTQSAVGAESKPLVASASLGTSGTLRFKGYMQEFRAWSRALSENEVVYHARDFESLALDDFNTNINSLISYLKLNDLTGSATGTGELHDYVSSLPGSKYVGFSSSALYNFPGKFINKLEQSYSYDFAINNDKTRVRNSDELETNDTVKDIPYLSVDFSPAVSLSKQISLWFGDLAKFNNIVGQPYNKYRSEITELGVLRYNYFSNKLNNKLNFESYFNLIKWFDANFSFFLSQLIPLDIISSLSNFVIEPHLLEYNKVEHIFPYRKDERSTTIEGSSSYTPTVLTEAPGRSLATQYFDPGRFGSPISASAKIGSDAVINYTGSVSGTSLGVNFTNRQARNMLDAFMSGNVALLAAPGYGNAFVSYCITGSQKDYYKQVLNVNTQFNISGVHYRGDAINSNYLTSTFQPINATTSTGSFNGVNDQRWLWNLGTLNSTTFSPPTFDVGIGYGGGWGQLYAINGKSILGQGPQQSNAGAIGSLSSKRFAAISPVVDYAEGTEDRRTYILWPKLNDFDGVYIFNGDLGATGTGSVGKLGISASMFGEVIPIEGYKFLTFDIIGNKIADNLTDSSAFRVRFDVRFQFFNGDKPSPNDFETVLSSSVTGSGYTTEAVPVRWRLETVPSGDASSGRPHSFNLNFERDLPDKKFMVVHMTVALLKSDGTLGLNNPIGYTILTKGTLLKERNPTIDELIKIRSF